MKNTELQAIRKALFLDVREAVDHIKTIEGREMSVRAWQLWEKGDRPVPSDVHCEMEILSQIMLQMQNDGDDYIYYRTMADYKAATGDDNTVTWRMMQAVSASQMIDDDEF